MSSKSKVSVTPAKTEKSDDTFKIQIERYISPEKGQQIIDLCLI